MQRSDILEAGGHEERDPLFLQVGLASQQASGKAINLLVEVGLSPGLSAVNQCDIARMGCVQRLVHGLSIPAGPARSLL